MQDPFLKANEGCLNFKVKFFSVNPIKLLLFKEDITYPILVSFDSNKSYLEFININGLKPKPIPVKVKVILIGDYETYDLLYNSDEDFKKLFPLRAEFSSVVKVNNDSVLELKNKIENRIRKNELFNINNEAINEMLKYLCRKSSSRNRIFVDEDTIDKLLVLANNSAKERKSMIITEQDILEVAYEEELIESEIMSMYEENKILISVKGEK